MRIFFTLLFFLNGCNSEKATKTETTSVPTSGQSQKNAFHKTQKNAVNQQEKIAGLSKAEDLGSSWKDDLGVSFSSLKSNTSKIAECGDQDKDGFFDISKCPWLSSKQGDCDDQNSSITPETEIWIPASPFIMGSESDHAGRDEKPVHVVFMDGYCLDVHEVRVGDFASFIRETKRLAQGLDLRSMSKDGVVEAGRENHPIEGVTFEEARDYCLSRNQRLPTEAEFEKASRGGCEFGNKKEECDSDDLRAYPWGNLAPNCQLANHQLSTEGFPKLCVSDTVEVDISNGQIGPYGHHHLSGNVWEYALDYWHPKVYASQEERKNPAGVKNGSIHVLRGGGWNTFSTNMRSANRFHDLVMGSASGFRCVRSEVELQYDDIEPLEMVLFSGLIQAGELKSLKGRAIYVSVFDAEDADEKGMVAPGRSPVAEVKLIPNNLSTQKFEIDVPKGATYFISAALDSGGGAQKDNYVSASGSGGFGRVEKEIAATKDQEELQITLQKPPQMPQMNPNMNTPKPNQPKNQNKNHNKQHSGPQHRKSTNPPPMQKR
jgi:formylglycine-generating enzyme required for sulfatase activity